MSEPLEIPATSLTYVLVPVANLTGVVFTGDTVQMGMSEVPSVPPLTYFAASWTTINSVVYAQLLIGPGSTIGALAAGVWYPWVKITDNPEVPVLEAPMPVRIV